MRRDAEGSFKLYKEQKNIILRPLTKISGYDIALKNKAS